MSYEEYVVLCLKEDTYKLTKFYNKHSDIAIAYSRGIFNSSCTHGKLETVKWIYDMVGVHIDNQAFVCACFGGHLHVIKWLCRTNSMLNIEINHHTINPNPKIIKFLCHLCPQIYRKRANMPLIDLV